MSDSALVRYEDLFSSIRAKLPHDEIVFCTGVFDLLHPGHLLFLEACKRHGDVLVVGVGNDIQVGQLKHGRPLYPEQWRATMIAALKPVDYCFIGPPETAAHPLKIVELGFEILRPDVYVVNEDALDMDYRRVLVNRFGIKFVVIPHAAYPLEFFGLSTSAILKKIRPSDWSAIER